jgi:uncharacterized protein (DUF433 family)
MAKRGEETLLDRITINPKVMVGKPVIKGTRIPVELILRMLAQGISQEEILKEYPRLQPEDIRAALAYAGEVVAGEEVFLLQPFPEVLPRSYHPLIAGETSPRD